MCALLSLTSALACSDQKAATKVAQEVAPAAAASPALAVKSTGRVTDAADILDSTQEQALSAKLEQLERATGRQLVVTTVPSLGGKEVAAFTRDLANGWGIRSQKP
jgi:uncharacterized protein